MVLGRLLGTLGGLLALCLAPASPAADISWTTSDFNTGNLDLSGTIVQAVNFGNTSETVTIGGDTVTLVSSTEIVPFNAGFQGGPNDGAAGVPTFTNVVGNTELETVLASHSWTGFEGSGVQTITLGGLFSGQEYQLQAFMHDGRTTGGPDDAGLANAMLHLSDDSGNASPTGTRGDGTIFIGTFTADAASQDFHVVGEDWDPGLSGYVLTATTGGTVSATLNRNTGQLTITNNASSPLDMLGYSVTSNFGGLNQANWLSVANNYDKPSAPTPGNGSIDANDAWTPLSDPASHFELSEAELAISGPRDGGAIGVGQTLDLGNVWIQSPTEDVVVEILRTDGTTFSVPLAFTGNGGEPFATADLNFDGQLTPADWDIFITNALTDLSSLSPAQQYQKGDLNNDGASNLSDMQAFFAAYDAANGAGSAAALLAGTPVPEPSAVFLLLLGGVGIAASRLAQRSVAAAMVVTLATGLTVPWIGPPPAEGAAISWGSPFEVQSPMDILAPESSTVHFAADFNTEDGFGEEPVVINGIEFMQVGAEGISGLLTHTLADGPNFGAAAFPGETGNTGLDNLMNSHSWQGGDPQTATVTLEGLTVGTPYQIQVMVADTRDCCAARTYEPDDGQGNFNTGTSINRGLLGSITGTFTADAPTQQFQWRSLNDETGNNDPAMSGLVVAALEGVFTLELEINTTSGLVTLKNDAESAFDLRGYLVRSEGGSLSTGGWTVPSGWEKAGGASETELLAGTLEDSVVLEQGDSISFGTAYNTTVDAQDLAFGFLKADGGLSAGIVSYVGGVPITGDYNGNGVVDAADYTVWRDNVGSSDTLQNDEIGGTIGPAHYTQWKENFGASGGSGAALGQSGVVPEPHTAGLFLLAAGMLAVTYGRNHFRSGHLCRVVRCGAPVAVALAGLWWASTSHASTTIDRAYSFGDEEDEDATAGAVVGSGPDNVFPDHTLDNVGPSGAFEDLLAVGNPVYVDVSTTGPDLAQARPGAASGSLGVLFDGADDYLHTFGLNYPATAHGSTGFAGPGDPGPLDYTGILDRGFQLWVYPDAAKQGSLQNVVLDSNQHGVRINADGNWVMRYNGGDVNSTTAVDFNQWSHVMAVRPFGTAAPTGGSILYVDGVAVAATGGGYSLTDTVDLVLGSNTGDESTIGTEDFFQGVLDDMEMFVMGRTANLVDRGAFNLLEDNIFVADSALSGLSGVAGDVNQDGQVNQADVTALLGGWQSEKRVNNVRVGDVTTILNGDLNFNGITNLTDVFILHEALLASGHATGFDFSLLPGVAVPEPATGIMLLAMMVTLGITYRRRNR